MIICAAIKDIRTGDVFCGVRHGDIYSQLHAANHRIPRDKVIEGFVDSRNNFYNRHEAFMWAMQIDQLPAIVLHYKQEKGETELYSEDLY